jgi:outer membrane immunogenic protein
MQISLPKILVVSLAFVAASAYAASADDRSAPAPMAPAPYNWTGVYAGLFGGGAFPDKSSTVTDCRGSKFTCSGPSVHEDFNLNRSFAGGLTLGYNWQAGKALIGLEGEGGEAHMSGSGNFGGATKQPNVESEKFGSPYGVLSARIGATANAFADFPGADRVLLFGKIGAAVGDFRSALLYGNSPATAGFFTENLAETTAFPALAVGGGVEWAIVGNLSVKAEYQYLAFNGHVTACGPVQKAGLGAPIVPTTIVCSSGSVPGLNLVKIGLNYKFF